MRQDAPERDADPIAGIPFDGGALDVTGSSWRLNFTGLPGWIELTGPLLTIDGRAHDLGTADVRQAEQIGRVTRITFALPGAPGLTVVLVLQTHPGLTGARLRISLEADRRMRLERPDQNTPFLGIRVARDARLEELRIGDFDPLLHSYRPFVRPLGRTGRADERLVGPFVRVVEESRQLLLAQEGPVEADHSFWPFRFNGAENLVFSSPEAGAMLPFHDLAESPWESEWFVVAVDRSDVMDAYRNLVRALGAEVGADEVAYNTWYKQEASHNVSGMPYLAHINPADLESEMDAAAAAGVAHFTIDVGWFDRTGDWFAHPERMAGGLQRWVQSATDRGMRLGLWMNPMVAAVDSDALRRSADLVMTRDGTALPPFPVWETADSVPMCLASDWAGHIERVLDRLADAGIRKVKFDGVWPATYEWAGRTTIYDCDSPAHFHGDASHTPEERRARYTYLAVAAVTRLAESASLRGMTVELDVTESFRFPRAGQLMHGRLFLINNGPYFHDLGVPPSTSIVPDTFNAVFFPHAAHSRIQRSATAFGELFPPGRVFGHVLVSEGDEKVLRNALATAAVSGLAIWGNLSALSPRTLAEIRSQLAAAARTRQTADGRGREGRSGFVGASPESYVLSSGSGHAMAAIFAHQPTRARVALPYPGDAPTPNVTGEVSWTRGDGEILLDLELASDDARLIFVRPDH